MSAYKLEDLRDREGLLTDRHTEWLTGINEFRDELLQHLLDVASCILDQPEEARPVGSFPNTYIGLASKLLSHADSIRAVVSIGRYGDAAMIIRGMIGDLAMIQYLSRHPSDCSEWVELSQIRGEPMTRGSRVAQLTNKFKEGNLRQLIEKGPDEPWSKELYGIYSEAAHASLWGMKFYSLQTPGEEAGFSFVFRPLFQGVAAFRSIGHCSAILFDAIDSFFAWTLTDDPEWSNVVEAAWFARREHLISEMESAEDFLTKAHLRMYPLRPTGDTGAIL